MTDRPSEIVAAFRTVCAGRTVRRVGHATATALFRQMADAVPDLRPDEILETANAMKATAREMRSLWWTLGQAEFEAERRKASGR